jgi:hypothetical protein
MVERADASVRRIDARYERLLLLVRAWQHNEYVTRCLRVRLTEGGAMASRGGGARTRLAEALLRRDRGAAEKALERIQGSAAELAALHQQALRCLDRVED